MQELFPIGPQLIITNHKCLCPQNRCEVEGSYQMGRCKTPWILFKRTCSLFLHPCYAHACLLSTINSELYRESLKRKEFDSFQSSQKMLSTSVWYTSRQTSITFSSWWLSTHEVFISFIGILSVAHLHLPLVPCWEPDARKKPNMERRMPWLAVMKITVI